MKQTYLWNEDNVFDGICYGAVKYRKSDIVINLSRLWNDTAIANDKIDNFIENYTKLCAHEWIHHLIDEEINTLFIEREEEIVDKITGTDNLSLEDKHLFLKIN